VSLTIFWVVVAISGILAAVTLVRINIEPKDNRLDTIIEILRDLVKSVDKLSNHIDILSDKIDKKESLDSNIQKSDNLGNKST